MDMIEELEYREKIRQLKKDLMAISDKLKYKDEEIKELKEKVKSLEKERKVSGRKQKLSKEEREILKMTSIQIRQGKMPTQRELAKEFGVSVGVVNSILKELK